MVELNKQKETFDKLNTEIIVVFREENKGVEGLQLTKEKTKSEFTMALDRGKKATPRYSPGRRKFDNYVVGPDGKIVAIIEGSLAKRAKSEKLIEILKELKDKSD